MNMAVQTPRTGDQQIEEEIVRKGKTAARVTPQQIEEAIRSEFYFTAWQGICGAMSVAQLHARHHEEDTLSEGFAPPVEHNPTELLTFCVVVLRNGFTVTGESACASPENFDAEIGRKIARQNAVQKIWPLEGYLLKQRLHEVAK